MKKFPRKIAELFFGIAFSFFALMNIISALPKGWPSRSGGVTFDSYETYGFPFVMHEYGTILHLDEFVWSGVVANLSVAFVSSLIIGLLAACLWQRVQKWRFRFQ